MHLGDFDLKQNVKNGKNLFSGFHFNDYIDQCLNRLRQLLKVGLDPMYVDPIESTFEYKAWFVNLTADLLMDNTILYHLSNVKRSGIPKINYKDKRVNLSWQMIFPELEMKSSYAIKVLNMSRNGYITANIKNLLATVDLQNDLKTLKTTLNDLKIRANGNIDVKIGQETPDALGSAAVKAIANLFKNQIVASVEEAIKEKVEETLAELQASQ